MVIDSFTNLHTLPDLTRGRPTPPKSTPVLHVNCSVLFAQIVAALSLEHLDMQSFERLRC